MKRVALSLILAVACFFVAALVYRQHGFTEPFHLDEFGRIPVLMEGRLQPIDSVARAALLRIRGTATIPSEMKSRWSSSKKAALDPCWWLLEVLAKPHAADDRKIFRVSDAQLVGAVAPAGGGNHAPAYYSFRQLAPKMEEISRRGERIREKPLPDRSASERSALELLDALIYYQRLKNSLQPNSFLQVQSGGQPVAYDFPKLVARYRAVLPAASAALRARAQGKRFDDRPLSAMLELLQPYQTVSRVALLSVVPPPDPSASPRGWQNVGLALRDGVQKGQLPPAVEHFAGISAAFARGDRAAFNRHVAEHRALLAASGLDN